MVGQAREFLIEEYQAHKKTFRINVESIEKAPWADILKPREVPPTSAGPALREPALTAQATLGPADVGRA
jgi:hypothetical protein